MRVIESGMVYDAGKAPANRRSCAFTSLLALASGGYRCTFRAAPGRDIPGGALCVMGSENGLDWYMVHSGLTIELDGIEGDMYAGYLSELTPGELTGAFVWVDRSNPARSFVHPETAGVLEMRNLIATSLDGGTSWHDWREIDLGPQEGCSCTGPIFSPGHDLLAFPYETWKSYEDPSPGLHTASLRLSSDAGRTWEERRIVATDPNQNLFYWDQRIAVHPDTGELVVMFWTHDRNAGRDLENHIAWSQDARSPWTLPAPTGWSGQHCQPLSLGGDLLAAIHTERTPPGGIIVRLSDDFGRSWNAAPPLRIYEAPAPPDTAKATFEEFWQSMMSWPFGHPRAVVTPDGSILAAWYAGEGDTIGVQWARITLDEYFDGGGA